MSKSHTPGHWQLLDYEAPEDLSSVKMQYAVTVSGKLEWICYAFRKEDAQLMAAAPDLLKALQIIVEALATFDPDTGRRLHDAKRLAQDAIAKAQGEAP